MVYQTGLILFNICLFYYSLSSLTHDPYQSLSQPLFLFANLAHSLSQPLNPDHSPVTHSYSSLCHRPPCTSPKVRLTSPPTSDLASNLTANLSSELATDYSSGLISATTDLSLNIAASHNQFTQPPLLKISVVEIVVVLLLYSD